MNCSFSKSCTAYDAIQIFVAAGAISNAGEALRTEVDALLQAVTIGRPIFAAQYWSIMIEVKCILFFCVRACRIACT
jgi:hypothetical protein